MAGDYIIGEIMVHDVVTAKPDNTLLECAKIMRDNNVGCVVVTDNGSPLGILTEQDISRKVVAESIDANSTQVKDVMSENIISIHSSKGIRDAIYLMGNNEIKHLPVVDNGKLTGIITAKDIVVLEPILMDKLVLNGKARRDNNHSNTENNMV